MSERQTDPRFACDDGDPADAAFMAKLQHAASLSNQNCDRATVLVRMLSAELRDAQQRINELEREADERVARAEAETGERLGRAWTEIEAAFTRLEAELAEARQGPRGPPPRPSGSGARRTSARRTSASGLLRWTRKHVSSRYAREPGIR